MQFRYLDHVLVLYFLPVVVSFHNITSSEHKLCNVILFPLGGAAILFLKWKWLLF